MKLLGTLDKILASFGNIRALERTHVDTYTENKINSINALKIGESSQGQLYIKFNQLAGYQFLDITILSRQNIKTFNGGSLIFEGEKELSLKSDTTEIESDFSNISNQWMTEVSFIVKQREIDFIKSHNLNRIIFYYKKKAIHFNAINNQPNHIT